MFSSYDTKSAGYLNNEIRRKKLNLYLESIKRKLQKTKLSTECFRSFNAGWANSTLLKQVKKIS